MTGYAIAHKGKGIRNIPKSYEEADIFLGDKLEKKVCNNTVLLRYSGIIGDSIGLRLHNTKVVTWYRDGKIKLSTGGWSTTTTKSRINAALTKTSYRVYSKKVTREDIKDCKLDDYFYKKSIWWIFKWDTTTRSMEPYIPFIDNEVTIQED